MTDNQSIVLREALLASAQNLRRARQLLESSVARRKLSTIDLGSFAFTPRTHRSPIETSLRAWQEFGAE